MKRLLQLSILANLALLFGLAAVLFLFRNQRKISTEELHPKAEPSEVAESRPGSNGKTVSQPFRRNQLESTDYPTYISNLRGVGCPEQTICDIITADVANLYEEKRRQFLAGPGKEQDAIRVRVKLDQLKQEQTTVIATLLGDSNPNDSLPVAPETTARTAGVRNPRDITNPAVFAEASAATVNSTPTEDEPSQRSMIADSGPVARGLDERLVSIPLVFQPGAVTKRPVSETEQPGTVPEQPDNSQATMISNMQQAFVNSVGDTSNPSSPEYRWRWQDAQARSDAQYRAQFGWNAFSQKQLEVQRQQTSQSPPM